MKYTKIFILVLLFILGREIAHGQVGVNTSTPDPSAVLDVNGVNKGILIPRMTTAQRLLISSPPFGIVANGLTVYDTDAHAPYIYVDNSWVLQRKSFIFPSRVFVIAKPLVAGGEISTPTGGGSSESDSNPNFSPVQVTMDPSIVSDALGATILSNQFPMTVGIEGTYLIKMSGRFRKSPANNLNMKTQLILLVNGVNKLNTYFHLPNADTASANRINYLTIDLAVGDVISVEVKKDRFTSTPSANLHGIFSDILLEIELLP